MPLGGNHPTPAERKFEHELSALRKAGNYTKPEGERSNNASNPTVPAHRRHGEPPAGFLDRRRTHLSKDDATGPSLWNDWLILNEGRDARLASAAREDRRGAHLDSRRPELQVAEEQLHRSSAEGALQRIQAEFV